MPEGLLDAIADEKGADDLGTPVVEQLALADFLVSGELDRHLRRTRATYRRRRDTLVAAVSRHLPGCRPAGVAAGLHLVVPLPDATDERAVLERARSRGIALSGRAEHSMRALPPALLLGYGRIGEPAIEAGVRELSAAVAGAA